MTRMVWWKRLLGGNWNAQRMGIAAVLTYRAVWLLLFAAAVVSVTWFNPKRESNTIRHTNAAYALGLNVYDVVSSDGVVLSPLDGAARRSGLRDKDFLLSVDGHRVPADLEQRTALLTGTDGTAATLELRHDDGELLSVKVMRDTARITAIYDSEILTFELRRWIAFSFQTLAAMASLMTAVLLFLRRPRDLVAQLLSLSLVLGQAGLGRFPAAPGLLAAIEPATSILALSLAILLFPDGRLNSRWHWLALVATIIQGSLEIWQYTASFFTNWSIVIYIVQASLILIAVMWQLRATPPGIARQQQKFVLFGIGCYALLTILTWLLVFVELYVSYTGTFGWWISITKNVSGALSGIAVPAGLLVSLLSFRLYDAETAISRSVAYGSLTLGLIAVFAAFQKVIEIVGEAYLGSQLGTLAGALAAALAAATIVPLHGRVTRWAERRFQGHLWHLRRGLPVLVGDLRETASPEALAEAMLVRLGRGVRASHSAIVAASRVIGTREIADDAVGSWMGTHNETMGGDATLHADRADPTFPLRVPLDAEGVGRVGWLLLGPRPDNSFYGRDEREALSELADPIARGLVIVLERARRDAKQHQEMATLRRTVDALRRFVRERFGVDVDATLRSTTAIGP